jgi:2-dehydro-3-deoxyglucarate aldolase/4-hydroxy-2-oxoheptanedioate aldolase
MLPQLSSAAAVREAVTYLKYPPVGARGVALRTRGASMGALRHADVARVVNERIVGIVQIENPGTVADADEIAAIDGVDVLFVGPADLSHSLGMPGRFDEPTYLDALRTVVAACERHGKEAGILLYDPAVVPQHLELGFKFVGLGSEGSYVSAGARATLAAFPGR